MPGEVEILRILAGDRTSLELKRLGLLPRTEGPGFRHVTFLK